MTRGIVPRQPAKNGRQDAVRKPVKQSAAVKTVAGKQAVSARVKPHARTTPASAPKTPKPPAGYVLTSPERVAEILKCLNGTYPGATCALHHHSAWELLVATILSAQCTDARVNMVTPILFQKYPTVHDFARLQPEELEPDIKSTGFFRNKSKSVVGAANAIVTNFAGKVPADMDQLLTLPGVARKTANVVLGTWFGKAEGVVVDTHVHRISRRLELTASDDPKAIEQDLMQVIPRDRWIIFAHQIILHGRALCIARKPKCAECPLENICHAADKTWSTVDLHKNATP